MESIKCKHICLTFTVIFIRNTPESCSFINMRHSTARFPTFDIIADIENYLTNCYYKLRKSITYTFHFPIRFTPGDDTFHKSYETYFENTLYNKQKVTAGLCILYVGFSISEFLLCH